MIIRESDEFFTMTKQHDHANFSGEVAGNFRHDLFIDETFRNDTLLAITEHDRGWIGLDDVPLWNDRTGAPFSFMDYPLSPKLLMYAKGIDEVEPSSAYAALLCSLHYTSFEAIRNSQRPDCVDYYRHELRRQNRLVQKLNHPGQNIVTRHFKLLQLCDEISLYVCFNEGGVGKEKEHPWYKEGFGTLIDRQKFTAKWVGDTEIAITPFPFIEAFQATLQLKRVAKDLRNRKGIELAYAETPLTGQTVTFVNEAKEA